MLARSNHRRIERTLLSNYSRQNATQNNINTYPNNISSQLPHSNFHINSQYPNNNLRNDNHSYLNKTHHLRNENTLQNENSDRNQNVNPNNHNHQRYNSRRKNPDFSADLNTNPCRFSHSKHIRNRTQHIPNFNNQGQFTNLENSKQFNRTSSFSIPRQMQERTVPFSKLNDLSEEYVLDDNDYDDDDDEDNYENEESSLNSYKRADITNFQDNCCCFNNFQVDQQNRDYMSGQKNISCPNSCTNLAFSSPPLSFIPTFEPFNTISQPKPTSTHPPSLHPPQSMHPPKQQFVDPHTSSSQQPFSPFRTSNTHSNQSKHPQQNYSPSSIPPFSCNLYPSHHQQTLTFPPPQTFLLQPPINHSSTLQQPTYPNSLFNNTPKESTCDLVNCLSSLIKQQIVHHLKQENSKPNNNYKSKPIHPPLNRKTFQSPNSFGTSQNSKLSNPPHYHKHSHHSRRSKSLKNKHFIRFSQTNDRTSSPISNLENDSLVSATDNNTGITYLLDPDKMVVQMIIRKDND